MREVRICDLDEEKKREIRFYVSIIKKKLLLRATKRISRKANEDDRNGDDFIYVNLEDIAGTMICTPSMKDPRVHYVT